MAGISSANINVGQQGVGNVSISREKENRSAGTLQAPRLHEKQRSGTTAVWPHRSTKC